MSRRRGSRIDRCQREENAGGGGEHAVALDVGGRQVPGASGVGSLEGVECQGVDEVVGGYRVAEVALDSSPGQLQRAVGVSAVASVLLLQAKLAGTVMLQRVPLPRRTPAV
jgi:hypothetical protein